MAENETFDSVLYSSMQEKVKKDLDSTKTGSKKRRGFAVMDRALVSAIASKGGKSAHAQGTAHTFTSEEARAAGRKGGIISHAKRRARIAAGG